MSELTIFARVNIDCVGNYCSTSCNYLKLTKVPENLGRAGYEVISCELFIKELQVVNSEKKQIARCDNCVNTTNPTNVIDRDFEDNLWKRGRKKRD